MKSRLWSRMKIEQTWFYRINQTYNIDRITGEEK